uniref:Uncharacterized protein n=1 Tax=viral metagenome TaxID=1070528 RepID=A0A6C0HG64_9ZZZZ
MPIILLFFNDTKKLIIHENSDEIFNRGIVNVLLEPYQELEGITYTYDDISTMIVNYYRGDYLILIDLPKSLKKLEINNSSLVNMPIFPPSIEKIIIRGSFIRLINEDFTKYPNLNQLELVVQSDVGSIYPPYLYKKIKMNRQERERDIYGGIETRGRINQLIAEGAADYRDGRDVTYQPIPVTLQPDANAVAHLVNNGQSVHISSINKAICKSITLINELAEKHPPVENPLEYIIKPKTKNVFKRAYHYVRNMFKSQDYDITDSNITIQGWFASTEIHSLHRITFATLFEKVMRVIIHHEHKEGLIERLREELTEALGLCFTGRINRLVNSLSGIVEGIKVSFSIEEQIQLESQKIIERLTQKTITLEKAKEEMVEIFNDEEIKNDDSLMRLKNDYVNALEDFAHDDTTTFWTKTNVNI